MSYFTQVKLWDGTETANVDSTNRLEVSGTVNVNNTITIADGGSSISIDDGGNTITVDGTVTANLSATDNTVLDAIDSNTDYGAYTGGGTESGVLRVTIANNSTGLVSIDDGGGSITVDGTTLTNIQNSLAVIDDWDAANFCKVVPSDGSNSITVLAAGADNASNSNNQLVVAGCLYGFDGTNWDRIDARNAASDSSPDLDGLDLLGTHALLSARADANTTVGVTCENSTHNSLHVSISDGEGIANVNASNELDVDVPDTLKNNIIAISSNTSQNGITYRYSGCGTDDAYFIKSPGAGNQLRIHHIYVNNAGSNNTEFEFVDSGASTHNVCWRFYVAAEGGAVAQNLKKPWDLTANCGLYYNWIEGASADMLITIGYETV